MDEPKLPRRRVTPKRLEDFHGYGPAKPTQLDKPKDLYRKHYYEALDHVVNCIEERFNQEDYRKYATLKDLILKAARKQPFTTELEEVPQFYNSDFDGSLLELHVDKKHFYLKYIVKINSGLPSDKCHQWTVI